MTRAVNAKSRRHVCYTRQILVLCFFTVLLVTGIVGTLRVKDGLDITDVVPKGTNEYAFLAAQAEYFGYYNFYAVTQEDFDYAGRQRLLRDYHDAFRTVDHIVKKEDGSLPHFWLSLMTTWLKGKRACADVRIINILVVLTRHWGIVRIPLT